MVLLGGIGMRGAYECIGLPVYDRVTGKRLGKVRDLILDESWKTRGILLEYKTWFASARFVEWKDIVSFGEDAFFVRCKNAVIKWKEQEGLHFLCAGDKRIKGIPLLTMEGTHLGRVEDVYFSPNMEDFIVGFELSEGFLTDLKEGRKRLPVPEGTVYGEDAIMVPVHQLEEADPINY